MEANETIKFTAEFEILDMEGSFAIKYKDKTIAEIAQWEQWEQTGGEPLPEFLFVALVDKIEGFYS